MGTWVQAADLLGRNYLGTCAHGYMGASHPVLGADDLADWGPWVHESKPLNVPGCHPGRRDH